jgi:hypothetical protein
MKRLVVFLVFLFFSVTGLFAQTASELIASGAKTYNAMRDYGDNLQPGKVTDADLDSLRAYKTKGEKFLNDARSSANAEQQIVIRYFDMFFDYELAFVYGMMGRNQDAFALLNPIKNEFEYFSVADKFPIRYDYFGKNYSIKYENFAPTLAEFYTGMAEITANLSMYDESLVWSRKSLAFSYSSDWYRYIACNKILEVKKKQDQWDKEVLDIALNQLQLYAKLDTSYKRTIKENNYPTNKTSVSRINTCLEKKPDLAKGEYHRGNAAPILISLNDLKNGFDFYEKAIKGGFNNQNKTYLLDLARSAAKYDYSQVGILALDKIRENLSSSLTCLEWAELAKLYTTFEHKTGETAARQKQKACEDEEKIAAERRRKAERRASRESGLYVGFYPGPLITRYAHYRDFGGVVGIMGSKLTIEASYKIINRNYALYDDLSIKGIEVEDSRVFWSGNRMHLALKFHPKNSSSDHFYMGPLFEIVNREFEPMYAQVFNQNNVLLYSGAQLPFLAKERSYSLFFNYGSYYAKKHFFADIFFGFGASYYQFDVEALEYRNTAFVLSNPVLTNRKPNRFGVVVRAGLTLGLSTRR